MGYEPRPDIPIYLAGLAPGMLRLAGEIADGVVLWLCNPTYIRDDRGADASPRAAPRPASRAEGFDIVAAVPSAVTSEPDQAKAQLRSELIPYFSLPFYRKMIELLRLRRRHRRLRRSRSGRVAGASPTTSSPPSPRSARAEEAAASVRRYADSGTTSPCVGGISKTDFDTTLEALAGSR